VVYNVSRSIRLAVTSAELADFAFVVLVASSPVIAALLVIASMLVFGVMIVHMALQSIFPGEQFCFACARELLARRAFATSRIFRSGLVTTQVFLECKGLLAHADVFGR
jgi:hypothetical protein